ncbi:MAG: CPBP family intramembrane metalloprotease [Clostridiales Family XIII bacterium]|jgi:membrane protease YdiL (CAAX protease family)|nr:CPBP family intramembrane metalloprotease [Clostridiales Family XIII bacterium]
MKKFFETALKLAALKIIALLIIWAVLLRVLRLTSTTVFAKNPALAEIWWQALSFLSLLVVSTLFTRGIERGKLRINLSANLPRDLALGILVGCLWIGGTVGLLAITDSISFGERQLVSQIVLWIIAVLINAIMQEYLIHGYMFALLGSKCGNLVAVSVTAVLFAALNVRALENGTISILFTFAASTLLALLRIHTRGLLAPIITHFIWNFVGGLVIGGVFLGENYPTVWPETLSGVDIISGGNLKFEGSGLALLVTIVLIDLMVILIGDDREKRKAELPIKTVPEVEELEAIAAAPPTSSS